VKKDEKKKRILDALVIGAEGEEEEIEEEGKGQWRR